MSCPSSVGIVPDKLLVAKGQYKIINIEKHRCQIRLETLFICIFYQNAIQITKTSYQSIVLLRQIINQFPMVLYQLKNCRLLWMVQKHVVAIQIKRNKRNKNGRCAALNPAKTKQKTEVFNLKRQGSSTTEKTYLKINFQANIIGQFWLESSQIIH